MEEEAQGKQQRREDKSRKGDKKGLLKREKLSGPSGKHGQNEKEDSKMNVKGTEKNSEQKMTGI